MICDICNDLVSELTPVMLNNYYFGMACPECKQTNIDIDLAVQCSENKFQRDIKRASDRADAKQFTPMGGGGENT